MKVTVNLHKRLEILSAHAPPAVSNKVATPPEAQQEFSDSLTECVNSIPKNNMIVVVGVMNARVIEATSAKQRQLIGNTR